jgi:hypothetical protein
VPARDGSSKFINQNFILGVFFSYYILYYIKLFSQIFLFILGFLIITCHRILGILRRLHKYFQKLDKCIFIYIISYKVQKKYQFSIWVQSRKKNQILRLDQNPYLVIFKLLIFSRWLCDDSGASPHQHVSRVVLIRTHRFSGFFFFFFWVLFERFADIVSLTDIGVVIILLFYIILFI